MQCLGLLSSRGTVEDPRTAGAGLGSCGRVEVLEVVRTQISTKHDLVVVRGEAGTLRSLVASSVQVEVLGHVDLYLEVVHTAEAGYSRG